KRDRLIHRDVLCGNFWGVQPKGDARKALRTALWRIRTVLEPAKQDRGTYVRVEGSHVGIATTEEIWADVWEFEDSLDPRGAGARSDGGGLDAARLERAALLYRGDLLVG